MDPKLKEKYIDCGGTFCPFCGSDDIESGESVQVDGGVGTQCVGCNVCHEEWTDVYTLKEVCYVHGDDRANAEVPVRTKTRPTE